MTIEICIYGDGSIRCYVGGRIAASGGAVSFVGRERIARDVRQHGLRVTDWRGVDQRVSASALRFATTPELVSAANLVLVTVKSAATESAGVELAPLLQPDCVVVSFQNGLHNADALRALLPGRTVLAGMVSFNVVNRGAGDFHAGSDGGLEVERHASLAPFLSTFERAGLPLTQRCNMQAVQWAKLLLNLNNAINALADIPLKQQLSQRAYRRCLALAQREALSLLAAAGVEPAKLTPLPPRWIPALLATPDIVFRVVASRMLAIDPLARSSMWEDLQARRTTEVDYLNGEIVRLAERVGRQAPVNARLTQLIHDAERNGRAAMSAEALLAKLQAA
ncbi:MAG: 2-dehydropantoate 2-reductase [Lysobacterales bacterium]|nr:MAG: 2-dehydropantoate 2-reductase [Xanthomonadales bacterium]